MKVYCACCSPILLRLFVSIQHLAEGRPGSPSGSQSREEGVMVLPGSAHEDPAGGGGGGGGGMACEGVWSTCTTARDSPSKCTHIPSPSLPSFFL